MHHSEDASTMDFLVFAVLCHVLYYYLVTNYGVPTSLEYPVWSLSASLVAVVVAVAQCFFSRRIYYLCRPQVRRSVTAPIASALACGGESVVQSYGHNSYYSRSSFLGLALARPSLPPWKTCSNQTAEIAVLIFVNNEFSALLNTK
ncbi:hypothetical protein EDD17DRAFT_1640186, partial [Pisolithus thermaeus]